MTQTVFVEVALCWVYWTVFELAAIYASWAGRSRVPGARLSKIPGVRRLGRRAAEKRIEELLAALDRIGVPENHRPDKTRLVERWHLFTTGRLVTTILQAVPLAVPVITLAWESDPDGHSATPFWAYAIFGGFSVLSMVIMAVDERAVRSCGAAGVVTVRAVSSLETLLLRRGRPVQQSALDGGGTGLGALCLALRDQARYEARRTQPADRDAAEDLTGCLIRNLGHQSHHMLFSEGAGRAGAMRELALLMSSALRYSCRPRGELDNLLFVDETLLADIPAADTLGGTGEPLAGRLARGVLPPLAAAVLLAAAAVLPGTGAAAEALALAGVGLVLASPPFRGILARSGVTLHPSPGGAQVEPEQPPAARQPATSVPAPARCPNCAESPAGGGSRPVG